MVKYYQLVWLIPLFPFIGFLINGIFGSKIKSEKIIGAISSSSVILSFILAIQIFIEMLSAPVADRLQIVTLFNWISAGNFNTTISFQVDQLSILMTMIVTGVGALIHIYAIGYMHGDSSFWRFFAYLNLFVFAMLNLVLADNFLLMFLGWEGVGLCSYLLIGFWYEKDFEKGTTGDAAKKAFIVNRIGDFGFLIALFLIFKEFSSLQFLQVFNQASVFSSGDKLLTIITLLLFLGATGKSAQIPLYVWLPDAMAGPTPVSALIHAATMVTAGVYLLARCSTMFILAPLTLNVVAIVGVLTAVFAGTIALVQTDIKKILAYSTISQLGYMFLACGVGAFSAGIFHLMTHAFFKALLFLGAGAVIHALHHEQNILNMGGLKNYLPKTFFTFFIAAWAISGIPPFSGFFSKDEILWKTFSSENYFIWFFAILGAGLTAFYMFRLINLTFYGESKFDEQSKPHEVPAVMSVPLIILAILSFAGGFVGIPHVLGGTNYFEEFLSPVFKFANDQLPMPHENYLNEYILMLLSVAVGLAGIFLARKFYLNDLTLANNISKKYKSIYQTLFNKYYIDEFYDKVIVNPIKNFSDSFLWKKIDVKFIDGSLNASARITEKLSSIFVKIQSGITETYVLIFIFGVVLILLRVIL